VILYTNTTPENGLRDAKRFETFAWMLDEWGPTLHKEGGTRIVAIGFASKGDYGPFRPTFEGKPVESVGFFLGGPFGKMLEFVSPDRPEDAQVIHHEYVHALTYDTIANAPPWAAEGFADLFSTFEPSPSEARFGHPIPGHAWVVQHEDPLPVAELTGLGTGHEYYQGKRRDMFYAESWALVHYLIHNSSMATFEKAVRALSAGEAPDVVLARAWPSENWSTLATRLRTYVEPEEMDFFTVALPADFVEPTVKSRAVPRAEILGVLGDLLLQEERVASPEAPAYYHAALAADAQDAAAVRGLGSVNHVRKFPKEADGLYQRAAAMTTASAGTLGQCAEGIFLLSAIDTAAGEAVASERNARAGAIALRALTVQPDEPRSLRIAAALADRDSAFAEQAIPPLEAAHRTAPRNPAVTGGLVRAYAVAGSYDAAQALYDTDKYLKADAEEAQAAARRLEQAGLKLVNADLHAGHTKEALARLEDLRASTKSPEFVAHLDHEIERLSRVRAANQWVDRYNEGIKAIQAQKLDQAVAIFEEVRKQSTDERLVFEAGRRLDEIKAFRAKTGS
jgi:tetratricopeptide (TPR) repeat protein